MNGVTDDIRSKLMPVNIPYNLEKLIKVCREFPLESRRRITFEYILIRDLTDSIKDAKGLIFSFPKRRIFGSNSLQLFSGQQISITFSGAVTGFPKVPP